MFPYSVLMCRPDHFTVKYSINPWMRPEDQSGVPDPILAHKQWIHLHHTIIRLGGYVHYIEQPAELPDMVFTANGGLVHDRRVVLPRFANRERQEETLHFQRWFVENHYETMSPTGNFEGNGDAFIVNGTLFLGSGSRTDSCVAGDIMGFLGLRKLVICELVDPSFYHLDTCFCPLSDGDVLYYPGAFSPHTLAAFRTEKINLVEVAQEDAERFACNSVVFGKDVVVPDGCNEAMKRLASRGYKAHPVAMSEFVKAGGAAKCLTLRV